ncbi:MAG: lipoprotein [Saprospiraceae bacterium]|nr:lipoprotein [Saprospiraceae bacterium]
MKRIFFALSILLLVSACKTKQATISAATKVQASENSNPMLGLCSCTNSKGLTVDAYGKAESEKQNLTFEEYMATLPELKGNTENWFFKNFIHDDVYRANMELLAEKFKNNPAMATTSEEDAQKMMEDVMKKYPVCWELLPFMLTVAK